MRENFEYHAISLLFLINRFVNNQRNKRNIANKIGQFHPLSFPRKKVSRPISLSKRKVTRDETEEEEREREKRARIRRWRMAFINEIRGDGSSLLRVH